MLDYIIPILAATVMQIHPPQLTTTPVEAFTDTVSVEVNGKKNSRVFVNGVEAGIIEEDGNVNINLDTSGAEGTKNFEIHLQDNANRVSKTLQFSLERGTLLEETLSLNEEVTIDGYAPDGHNFYSRNLNSPMQTFEDHVYIVSHDEEFRPFVNKYKVGGNTGAEFPYQPVNSSPLDKDEVDVYTALNDSHHQFSLGVDAAGYIHIIGDMHHGGKGSHRDDKGFPLSERFHNDYGDQMYWISDNPKDVTSFSFVGNDPTRNIPAGDITSHYITNDNNNKLYMGCRQSVKRKRKHIVGIMGHGMFGYDSVAKKWTAIGGIPVIGGLDYGLPEKVGRVSLGESIVSILWEPHAEFRLAGPIWYQSPKGTLKFDKNNFMHFTCAINGDKTSRGSTHIVYARSNDGGETFNRADGSQIQNLPIRATGLVENRGSIVLSKEQAARENIPAVNMKFKALLWNKDFYPAVSWAGGNVRFYDKASNEWKYKKTYIKVNAQRVDHHTLVDDTMIHFGADKISRSDKFVGGTKTIYSPGGHKSGFNFGSLTSVDNRVLNKENIMRGISYVTINNEPKKKAIVSIQFPDN